MFKDNTTQIEQTTKVRVDRIQLHRRVMDKRTRV